MIYFAKLHIAKQLLKISVPSTHVTLLKNNLCASKSYFKLQKCFVGYKGNRNGKINIFRHCLIQEPFVYFTQVILSVK